MIIWKPLELKKLQGLYSKKDNWETDYQFSGRVSRLFKKSPESIRWQVRQFHRGAEVRFPKIGLLDIETLPLLTSVWGTKKQYISPVQVEKDWSIVCWSAKWLFSDRIEGEVATPKEAIAHTDKSIMGGIWDFVNEADIVITYNGDGFDLKRLNWRWLVNGFPRPMYYKSIDLYKTMTENFDATYNKMDWVNDVLGIGRKIQTSFYWWKECQQGNKTYLNKMLEYNMQDVNILEELYLKLRPWISNHPNINVFSSDGSLERCKNCGELGLKWDGKYSTPLGLYRGYRCQRCGAIGRNVQKKYKLQGLR